MNFFKIKIFYFKKIKKNFIKKFINIFLGTYSTNLMIYDIREIYIYIYIKTYILGKRH